MKSEIKFESKIEYPYNWTELVSMKKEAGNTSPHHKMLSEYVMDSKGKGGNIPKKENIRYILPLHVIIDLYKGCTFLWSQQTSKVEKM